MATLARDFRGCSTESRNKHVLSREEVYGSENDLLVKLFEQENFKAISRKVHKPGPEVAVIKSYECTAIDHAHWEHPTGKIPAIETESFGHLWRTRNPTR